MGWWANSSWKCVAYTPRGEVIVDNQCQALDHYEPGNYLPTSNPKLHRKADGEGYCSMDVIIQGTCPD